MGSFATAFPFAGAALISHQKPLSVAGLCRGSAAAGLSQIAVNCWGLQWATGLGGASAMVTEELEHAGLPRRGQEGESPPRNRLSARGCNVHGSQCHLCQTRHSPWAAMGWDRTRTPPVQPASCAWRYRDHRGKGPGMQVWSQALQRSDSRTLEPQLCRSGDEHFMVKYAECGTKEKAFLA